MKHSWVEYQKTLVNVHEVGGERIHTKEGHAEEPETIVICEICDLDMHDSDIDPDGECSGPPEDDDS